jgi:PKD repeat protein
LRSDFYKIIFFFFLNAILLSGQSQNRISSVIPRVNQILFDSIVSFEWNQSPKETTASLYTLSISSDSLFTTVFYSNTTVALADSVTLNNVGQYYWRLDLIDAGNLLATSEINSFTYSSLYSLPNLNLLFLIDSGLIVNGANKVEKWINLADTTRTLVQNVDSLRPVVITNISELQNNSVIRFDGVDNSLATFNSIGLAELYTLANWRGGNNFNGLNGLINGRTSGVIFRGATNSTFFGTSQVFRNTIRINSQISQDFGPLVDYKILSGTVNGTFPLNTGLLIGSNTLLSGRYWNGDLGEMIGFSSPVNDSIRTIVKGYFCSKYGKPLSLGIDIQLTSSFCDTILSIDTSYTSYTWSNGDTTNFSTLMPGNDYRLTVTNKFGCSFTDEISVVIPFNVPEDQFLCIGDTFIWDTQFPKSNYSFNWVGGSGDSLLTITEQGNYYCIVTDSKACTYTTDTLRVTYDSALVRYTLGVDTALCAGNSIQLINDSSLISSYLWSTGDTFPSIVIDTSGIYSLRISNGSCFNSDTVSINVKGQAPQANFSSANYCFQDSVEFTDSSVSQIGNTIVRWLWDFGDGISSVSQHPKHKYIVPGNYNVILEVENDSGCVGVFNQMVTIYPTPVSQFSTSNRCELDSINFLNQSTISLGSIVNYNWDFDESSINSDTSILENPKYFYSNVGVRNIRLISISDQTCVDTTFQSISVNPIPQVDFTYQGTIIRDSTQFTNSSSIVTGSIVGYTWNFGDLQSSMNINPKIIYENKGSYLVNLQATSDSNCVIQVSKIVKIEDAPPEFNTEYPKGGQTLSTIKYLQWNMRDSAHTYEVQVATDSNFASLELVRVVGQKNNLPNVKLSSGLKFWRVLAKNGAFFDTTNVASFTVFNMLELDSLNLWLRGDSGVHVTAGTISQWNDLSDSAIVLNQSILNRQPILIPSALNGFSVLSFDNVDDQFVTPLLLNGKNFTISAVYNLKQNTGASLIRGSNNWRFGPYFAKHRFYNGSSPEGKIIVPDRYVVHSAISIDDTVSNYVNNELFGSRKNSFPPGLLTLGANAIDGNVAEVVIVNGKISNEVRKGMDQYLMDKYAPPVDVGPDRRVCSFPDSITLDIDYAVGFTWDTGDTTATAIIDSAGKYFVTITDMFERTSIDSVYFILDTFNHTVNIPYSDTTICQGESVELIAGRDHYRYSWNNFDTTFSVIVDSAMLYIVELKNCEGIVYMDSVNVYVNNPSFDLGLDTAICHNGIVQLSPDSIFSNVNYLWSTGGMGASVLADITNEYSLIVTDNYGCQFSDSINITIDSSLFGLSLGNDTTLCVGNQIKLINSSLSIMSYLWSTGSQSSQIVVDTAGVYTLKTGNGRCFVNDSISILIKGNAPQANFVSSDFCFQDSVTFIDNSQAPTGDILLLWKWQFGNGDSSLVTNPRYNYSTRSDYTVLLTVETDKGCTDTISKIVRIEPLPVANFNFQNSIACAKSRIFHQDSSFIGRGFVNKYFWNFGDLNSIQNTSIAKDPFHTYDTLGSYSVQLIVESDQGCTDSISKIFTVNATPNVNFEVNNLCISDSVGLKDATVFAGTDTLNYFWTIRKIGSGFNVDRRQNPKIKINTAGLYDIGLRVRNNLSLNEWCEANKKDTIEFFNSPIADFIVPTICENDSFTVENISTIADSIIDYRFILDNRDTVKIPDANFEGLPNGNYSLRLKVINNNACIDSMEKVIEVFSKPEVGFTILNNNTGIPFSVDLDNRTTNAISYIWDFGNGDTSHLRKPEFTYSDTGTYRLNLIATSIEGCKDSADQELYALLKLIDANLDKLFLIENDLGGITVSFQIINTGFNTIDNLLVAADLNNEFQFRESYNTKIYAGRKDGFEMEASFIPDAGKKIDFVCVRIIQVNKEQDFNAKNNELCELGFNDELSITLYPNPVEDLLSFQYTLPDDGVAQIQFFDALGRERKNGFSKQQEEGFYSTVINLVDFTRGIYYYRFIFNGNVKTGKFMVK